MHFQSCQKERLVLAFLLLSCSIIFFSFVHSLCLSVHSVCLSIDGKFLLWPMSFSSLPRVFVIFAFIHYPKFLSTLCFFLALSVCLSLSINYHWCYLSSQLSFLTIFIRSLRFSPTSLVSKDNSVHIPMFMFSFLHPFCFCLLLCLCHLLFLSLLSFFHFLGLFHWLLMMFVSFSWACLIISRCVWALEASH